VCNAKGLAGAVRNVQRVCHATLFLHSARQCTRYVGQTKTKKVSKTKPAQYMHPLHGGAHLFLSNFSFSF
jgi:hypothetical protein